MVRIPKSAGTERQLAHVRGTHDSVLEPRVKAHISDLHRARMHATADTDLERRSRFLGQPVCADARPLLRGNRQSDNPSLQSSLKCEAAPLTEHGLRPSKRQFPNMLASGRSRCFAHWLMRCTALSIFSMAFTPACGTTRCAIPDGYRKLSSSLASVSPAKLLLSCTIVARATQE